MLGADARYFAILNDIDAALIGTARIAPCDGIMANRAATALHQGALNGEAGIVKI